MSKFVENDVNSITGYKLDSYDKESRKDKPSGFKGMTRVMINRTYIFEI